MEGPERGILSLFPLIADRRGAKRVESAGQFVKQLQEEQIEEENRKKDIEYCIDR